LGEAHAGKEHLAARLSALIKGLPGGVLVLDAGGEILECNPAARELLGEPLLARGFNAVLARATVNAGAVGEHTELRSGRFVNISRRELTSGGEVVLGQWQRILMAELDGPRARSLRIQIFGIS